jgi:uncharacterized membrane protein YfcA
MLTLGAIPAVFIAALIVQSLPLTAMRWLVAVVAVLNSLAVLFGDET